MALLTPAPLTPALINATRKNNADLGPALYIYMYTLGQYLYDKRESEEVQ